MLNIFKKPSFTYTVEKVNGKLKRARAYLDINKENDVVTLDNAISTLIRLRREILEAEENQQ